MQIRERSTAFELRIEVLDAIRQLGHNAILSRIATLTNTSQRTLRSHLAFLQVKDLITVADHTVEDRGVLKRRSISNVFRITPKGNEILSQVLPVRDELTSDKKKILRRVFGREFERNGDVDSLLSV
jgi:predicted transcriptional regulator